MSKKLVLIDGHSILNRAFYGVPDLTNSKGMHTNAVYGFLNIMFKILEEEKPDYLTVAFDVHAKTFRHEMYEAYKGTRKAMPEELREQVPVMKEVLKAMNVVVCEQAGLEADDILGTLAKKAEKEGMDVALVSGDRDLLQIATDKIKIRIPKTKQGKTEIEDYYAKDVLEAYQVTPLQFIELKALMGDTADNIPGVPKVGTKTATELMVQYGSIENIYAHVEEITKKSIRETLIENRELADLSKVLATIKIDCDLTLDYDEAKAEGFYTKEAYELFKKLEFKNLLGRFESQNAVTSMDLTVKYITLPTKEELQTVLKQAEQVPVAGVMPIWSCGGRSRELFGVAVSISDEKTYIYTEPLDSTNAMKGNSAEETKKALKENKTKKNAAESEGQMSFFAMEDGVLELKEEVPPQNTTKEPEEKKEQSLGELLFTFAENMTGIFATFDVKPQYQYLPQDDTERYFDILIGAYLLNPLKSDFDVESIAATFLGMVIPGTAEVFGKLSVKDALTSKEEEVKSYYAYGAFVARRARDELLKELQEAGMEKLMQEIEMPLSLVLYDMEKEGIRVKRDELKSYGDALVERISALEKSIHEQAGRQFNILSPKQLGEILFEQLNLPGGKKTKTGYSTAADVLEKLSADYPIVKDILEYRGLTKLKSTYADGLAAYIEEDERIHSNFNQTITATGRISSTEPNLQNIPMRMELGRRIRKVFVPDEGKEFLDADYSQIELRVLAHMSGDEQLIEAYRADQDIHRITASKVFHTPFEEVTDLQRRNAKAVNFGIVYGISSFGLSQDLSITTKEAAKYIEQYFETYPKVKEYLDALVKNTKDTGYSYTLYGRRRPVPEIGSSNFMQRSFGERIAMNSPVQGTAADIIKIAMINVWRNLKQGGYQSKLILQVHDELLIETLESEKEAVLGLLVDSMKSAADLAVNLEVDAHSGKNWFEAK